jgi:hypothetical protein
MNIRRSAFAYLHGHKAGGTNPSLLEAMGTTKINIAFDVEFNREVGGNTILYFNNKSGSLTKIINKLENINSSKVNAIGLKARKRIMIDYSWNKVVKEYKSLFSEILGRIRNVPMTYGRRDRTIAVITILSRNNYGAILQGYALYSFLSKMGNKIVIIDYCPRENNCGLKLLFHFFFHWCLRRRRRKLRDFLGNNLPLTSKKYTSYAQLCEDPPSADIYIVGSDQVWTEKIFHGGVNYGYLLGFAGSKKRISYSSSIGETNITHNSLIRIVDHLRDFQHISIREQSVRKMLAGAGVKNVHVVLDPVFLLDRKKYERMAVPFRSSSKYLLIYGFEESKELDMVSRSISENLGLKKVEIGSAFRKSDSEQFLKDLGVEEFLGAIINAEYIISTSFHGTALSIIMQKQFISILPSRGPDRIIDLLDILGLKDRIITNSKSFNLKDMLRTIDYGKVERKKVRAIENSMEYLANSLKY